MTVIVNPGGTNEKFDRANLKMARIEVWSDNLSIFDHLEKGDADVMITDATETLYQQKLHAGVLCAIHPDAPFDFSEKAYLMPRDEALKAIRRPMAAHQPGQRELCRDPREVAGAMRYAGQ